jgi:hypothetical protein
MEDEVPFVISVVRTGGLAGLRREWTVEVGVPDDLPHWQPLIEACPWDASGGDNHPDGFVYDLRANTREARVPERELSGAWQHLVEEVQRSAP